MNGLKDGCYEAVVDGQNGPMTVRVTAASGKFAKVVIADSNETDTIAGPAPGKM